MQLNEKMKDIVSRTRSNGFNPVVGNIWLMQEYSNWEEVL